MMWWERVWKVVLSGKEELQKVFRAPWRVFPRLALINRSPVLPRLLAQECRDQEPTSMYY